MATARERPWLNGNFTVDLGVGDADSVRAGFSEVLLPDACVEVLEYRVGNENTHETRKLPGSVRYGNLVLRRGLIGELDLYQWWDQARQGDPNVRRTVTVQLLSEDRSEAVFTWRFKNAWITRYSSPDLRAEGSDVAIEEIEIAFEGLELS